MRQDRAMKRRKQAQRVAYLKANLWPVLAILLFLILAMSIVRG